MAVELYTRKQVAQYLGVHRSTICRWVEIGSSPWGKIPPPDYMVLGDPLYTWDSVTKFPRPPSQGDIAQGNLRIV